MEGRSRRKVDYEEAHQEYVRSGLNSGGQSGMLPPASEKAISVANRGEYEEQSRENSRNGKRLLNNRTVDSIS